MNKKILFITRTAIKSDTNAGNTLHNLFSFCKKEDCTNIYCREELPNIDMCSVFYCISENELIKNIFNNKKVGRSFSYSEINNLDVSEAEEKHRYESMKKHRLVIFLWIREMIWSLTRRKWDNGKLRAFISDNAPDIIYMPIYDCFYMHKLLYLIKKYSKSKVVLYSGDDIYSYNIFNYSPLYYINQFILRKYIEKSIKVSSAVICLSELEKELLEKKFGNKVYQVNKSFPIPMEDAYLPTEGDEPLKMVFAGNLGYGRWKTLSIIGDALNRLNRVKTKCYLDVYTSTVLNKKQYQLLSKYEFVKLHEAVSYNRVAQLHSGADILLNIESFEPKDIRTVRMSFSTKIVDYLFSGRCILSIGPMEANSISYLVNANVSLYAKSSLELVSILEDVYNDRSKLRTIAHKAYIFGAANHDSEAVSRRMEQLLYSL